MIKFVKSLFKMAEGLLVIFLPVVIFYWTLSLINLDVIKPIYALVGIIIDPIMEPFKSFIEYRSSYNNTEIDYSVLIFAGLIVISAYILNIIGHVFTYIEKISDELKNKINEQQNIYNQSQERVEYIKELNKNKTILIILKLIRNEPKETYLLPSNDDDFFSVGLVESYENAIVNFAIKHSGKSYGNISDTKNTHGFIFDDVSKFLEYLSAFKQKIQEINQGMIDLNVKFEYKVACHCTYSETSAEVDFEVLNRMINLCGTGEIFLSELLKCRLDVINEIKEFDLFSRGIYLIKDKQIDLFKLQFKNIE